MLEKKILTHAPSEFITIIKAGVKMLYSILSKNKYLYQLELLKVRWGAYQGVKNFMDYFWKGWLDSRFKN